METNETIERSRVIASGAKNSLDSKAGENPTLSTSFLADPAALMVFQLIVSINFQTVTELKSYLGAAPEIVDALDSILLQLEESGIIRVEGEQIICPPRTVDFGSEPTEQIRYLPNFFKILVKRVLRNEIEDPQLRKDQKEMVRWVSLPDHPEIAAEARQIDLEYKAKLTALQEKASHYKSPVNGVRVMGIVDCIINPEDFG